MFKSLKCDLLLLLCSFLLSPLGAGARETGDKDIILIISSYNPDTRRMASFITEFEKNIESSDVPCDIYVETLECKSVGDAPQWMSQIDNMITRYEAKGLRAIILLGQEAWASFVSLDRIPEDVLCFSCFVSSNGIMLPAPAGGEAGWMPRSVDYMNMTDSLGNVGGLLNKYDIGRNVDLIRSLYPEVENIALISDNTYGGISLQALFLERMEYYPDITPVLIDYREGDEATHEKYGSLSARSAVMLGTWRVGRDGEYLMQKALTELVQHNPRIPVFSVSGIGIGDIAIGGYIPNYENGAANIASQIKACYEAGDNGPMHFRLTDGKYAFDSRKIKEWKIPEYSLPRGAVIEDTMAVTLSKYSHYIEMLVGCVMLLVLLLILAIWLQVRAQRLTRTLRHREEELVVARERAEVSDMLKSAFLANMSHEIRTPLNAIVGFSSLMQDGDLSQEERAEYCSIVVNNSEMLLTLLNDILDISSLECGKIHFNYTQEDVVQICQHVALTTSHTLQPGVEFRFDCALDSYMLTTDSHRLSQILINLLTNAGKFTAQGCITLGLEVRPEQGEVLFSVTDTGIGIPLEKQEQVFNRFEKLEGNMKGGTGLGLAICRQISIIVGGRIWVDPTYTRGARFVFAHPMNIRVEDSQNRGGISDRRITPTHPRGTMQKNSCEA